MIDLDEIFRSFEEKKAAENASQPITFSEKMVIWDISKDELNDIFFTDENIENLNFQSGNWSNSSFEKTEIKNCIFRKTKFSSCIFTLTKFVDCEFHECDFTNTKFQDTRFSRVVFQDCSLNEVAEFLGSSRINTGYKDINSANETYPLINNEANVEKSNLSTTKVRIVQGRVISNKTDRKITVVIERFVKHPIYGKFIKRNTKLHVLTDGQNEKYKIGDIVTVKEIKPVKDKNVSWVIYTPQTQKSSTSSKG